MSKAAHIITERQKKGALSTVKKKQKVPKNVLVKNQIEFWPILDESKTEEFTEILKCLTSEKENLKKISKGLESTLRALKRNELKLLVIAEELTPRWFAQHLVSMALHRKQSTKVLIVKNLKEMTKNLLKVPSIVFGVISSDFDDFCDNKVNLQSEFLKNFHAIQHQVDVSIKKKKKKVEEIDHPVKLLMKSPGSSREFIPMDIEESPESPVNLLQDTSGFISFSKINDSSSSFFNNSPMPSYRPIKIKKIVGNSARKEKKT